MTTELIDHKVLFDQMPVTRFLIRPSEKGFVVSEVNDLGCQFFAKPFDCIIGRPLEDLFTKDNAKRMAESFKICIKKKSAVTVPALPSFPGNISVPGF